MFGSKLEGGVGYLRGITSRATSHKTIIKNNKNKTNKKKVFLNKSTGRRRRLYN
jgi:hypothetical protein